MTFFWAAVDPQQAVAEPKDRISGGSIALPGAFEKKVRLNFLSSAKVALSSTAASTPAVAGDGSFDGAKVERIATAIREGKFTINAEAIAEKLIINAEELLGRGKSN